MDKFKVSIIIPTKGGEFLEYVLKSLKNQTLKPEEVILVLKECELGYLEKLCLGFGLNYIIEEQKSGFFPHALNIGKRIATGDILIFTDDDVVVPERWVENYSKLFSRLKVASISSRDIYYDIKKNKLLKTPDDFLRVKLFRNIVRPIFDPPIPILSRYSYGSYISMRYKFVFGKGIPNKECFSLPFRGVNMAFMKDSVEGINFLEHEHFVRGFRCEQHFGLQLILKGYESVYTPQNPVYHILRESLSRVKKKIYLNQLKIEESIVREEIKMLLGTKLGS